MPKFYNSVIRLINQSKEIGDKQFSVFGSKGGQISPLMHVPLCSNYAPEAKNGPAPGVSLKKSTCLKPLGLEVGF